MTAPVRARRAGLVRAPLTPDRLLRLPLFLRRGVEPLELRVLAEGVEEVGDLGTSGRLAGGPERGVIRMTRSDI